MNAFSCYLCLPAKLQLGTGNGLGLGCCLQANRARTVLIQQMYAFFAGNGIDAFIGPPVNETFMGNVVGLPEIVIPVAFNPVSRGSPRQSPTSVGISALPNQDSKASTASCSSSTPIVSFGVL